MARTGAAMAALALTLTACSGSASDVPAGSSRPTASGTTAVSSPPAATGAGGPVAGTDWPTYHRTNDRAGLQPNFPAPHSVATAWTARLDGAVYGQPLVIGDLVVAATESNTVYGLRLSDGGIAWRRPLGTPVPLDRLPCGNIDPLGITGTPAYDPATGQVFVATETTGGRHTLVGLDARSGAVRLQRPLDVTSPARDPRAEQQRGALAVAGGRVYVPFGGLFGDCGNYVGYITATPVTGGGATTRYEVPTRREGGMWAASGLAVDSAGDVWAAVGNGASFHEPYDGSDSVLRLSPDLAWRLDYFAPTTWGSENAEDADLGSTGPLLLGGGRALIAGKTAVIYLLDTARLGGIGGQIADLEGCRSFGGMAWDAATHAAFLPCTEGLLRVDVGASALRAGWRAGGDVTGSPVLGGGAVWAMDTDGGVLHVLDARTGATITTKRIGPVSRFTSPVLTGHTVLIGTLSGVTALSVR